MALDQLKNMVKKGEAFSFSDEEYIGIYFSAHWCPPCRGFTPKLAEFYNKVKAAGEKFEIVFVSSDRDEESFNDYYKEMPWVALKFEDRDAKAALAQMYSVSGIPTLVILDKSGNLVTPDGRGKVMAKLESGNPSASSWS